MDLDAVSKIAEIVSSVAVVVSLIYVGLQVRQNTRALRASTYSAVVGNSIAILNSMSETPEFTEFFVRVQSDPDAATPAELMRFHMSLLSGFRHWDNLYYQFRNGMLDRAMWESYDRTMTTWLDSAAWRDWFTRNAACFSEDLQALLAQRIRALSS